MTVLQSLPSNPSFCFLRPPPAPPAFLPNRLSPQSQGPTPLSYVLDHTDATPTRLLRQLGQDVLDASSHGLNKPEMVWSCCLQSDRAAGCTVPSPSHLTDVAKKRRERKAKSRQQRSRTYRPRSRSGRVRVKQRNVPMGMGSRSTSSLLRPGSSPGLRSPSWVSASSGSHNLSHKGAAQSRHGSQGRVLRGTANTTPVRTPAWRHNAPTVSSSGPPSREDIFEL